MSVTKVWEKAVYRKNTRVKGVLQKQMSGQATYVSNVGCKNDGEDRWKNTAKKGGKNNGNNHES